ncbi:MAG: glycosyltransferase family 2 protein [bacterium]|nr:glycosyltransferase family 2 protein [bacterium]
MSPKVTINLLGWNSKKYLKQALDSILRQTYPNLEAVYIDNASQDGSVVFARENFPSVKIVENEKNLGYAAGHNIGIREARGEYVICMNPDVVMARDFVERAVETMRKNETIGVIGGKLFRMKENGEKTKIIDSTGLKIEKSRRVIDRGQGEADRGQYEKQEQVFGISGALSVFRKSALEDVKIFGEYFDQDFENYKEDIDLCWRLNLYGWKSVYAPQALAYHERGTGASEKNKQSLWAAKKQHSFRAKYFSFKNQSLMLAKNDFLRYYLLDLPFIFWYEIKRWGYVLLREPKLFRSFSKLISQLPRAFSKRRVIMARRRIKIVEIRKFFIKCEMTK